MNTNNQPNIIYILADDMGYGDISYLNENSKIHTPYLDQMGREGMVFTDAHSSSAVCTPSRYSILTGRYNWRSTLKYGVLRGYNGSLIEQGRETVASMLQQAGYHTACVGKWHLGLDWARNSDELSDVDFTKPIENGPNRFGFDYYYGISASLDMDPYVYIENDRVTMLPDHLTKNDDMKAFWREGPTAPDFKHEEVLPKLTSKVLEKIEEYRDSPFFIYFPMPAPHTPILPTPEFVGKSGTNLYGDFVLMCDDVVGQIMKKLDELNLSDNTIVVYTSDNGCSPRANYEELLSVGHNPSYVFRGHKADIYEGGHRIPLLVKWPMRIAPGSISAEPVCLVDLMRTMAEIIGFSIPDHAGEDSVSNLPCWLGNDLSEPLREAIVHHSLDGSFSIRQGRWKLELCPGSGGWSYPRPGEEPPGTPDIQLYDLHADLGERNNVYDRYPKVVVLLKSLLKRYIQEGRSTPGSVQQNTGPAQWNHMDWMVF
jgi:arylsulfatase A